MRSTFYVEGMHNIFVRFIVKELLGRDSGTQYHIIFCVIDTIFFCTQLAVVCQWRIEEFPTTREEDEKDCLNFR